MTTIKELVVEVIVPLFVAFALQTEEVAVEKVEGKEITAEQEVVLKEERKQAEESVVNFGVALVDAAKDVRETIVTNAYASENEIKEEKKEETESLMDSILKKFKGEKNKEENEDKEEKIEDEKEPSIALTHYRPIAKVENNEKPKILKPFGTYEPIVFKEDGKKREKGVGTGASFKTDIGAAIYSPVNGEVIQVKESYDFVKEKDFKELSPADRMTKLYGNYIKIKAKNGTVYTFSYLTNTFHNVGDTVKAGEVIGLAGETGEKAKEELKDEEYKYGVHIRIKTEEGHDLNPMLLMDLPLPFENSYKIDVVKTDIVDL